MTSRFIAWRMRATGACVPLTVHLELTYRCNAQCAHCFQADRRDREPLSCAEWLSILDQAREAGALILTLSGGEPLLSPHLWAIAERARALRMALKIFTNGILLDRANVRRIAQLRPLSVEVSIFSARPEVHDAATGVPGSLSRAVRGLFRLRRAGVPVGIKCPLLAASAPDYPAVAELARRLGASVIFDPQLSPRADGSAGPTRCRGEDSVIEAYFADPAVRSYDQPVFTPADPDRPPCGMARSSVVVSPEGDVLTCPIYRIPAGNVRTSTLQRIWAESPLLERLRNRRNRDLQICGTCPRSGYCGRCSAIAFLEDGDLDGPSTRACRIAELRERAFGVPPPPGAPDVATIRRPGAPRSGSAEP